MIHIFDIDNTILKRTSAWYFLREALREGIIRFSQIRYLPVALIKYKLGRPDMDFIEEAVKHIAGIEKNAIEHTAEICFERCLKPNIYTGAIKMIKDAIGRGERVIFASSSLYSIIQPLEHFLNIEYSIATALEFDGGKTTGKVIGDSFFGIKKKTAVELWLNKNGLNPCDACFYSDSYTDLPLLEFCGKPVAVNPDRVLTQKAKKNGWEIIRFTETLGDTEGKS